MIQRYITLEWKRTYLFIYHITILSIKLYPRFITMCQPYWLIGHTSNSKQLTVLWCWTIWIFNTVMKGYWVQSSTCEVCMWIKIGLIPPDYRSWCIAVFEFSKILAQIIHEIDLKSWNIIWIQHSRLTVKPRSS